FPVGKGVGEEVIGATVNQDGLIKFKATKVGKDTLLYQIVKMVEEAQASKAPIQDLVDKISEYFVPAVVMLSVIVFVGWVFFAGLPFRAGLMKMIAVLVISCPCAMGLATPTALVVGIGRATKFGIILKGGEALEKAYRVNTIAFDKTGTLTIGEPKVTDIVPAFGVDEKELLRLSAALETGSEHPLARAVIAKGKEMMKDLPSISDFRSLQGMGIEGMVEGKKVVIGNTTLLKNLNYSGGDLAEAFERLQGEAKTVVYVFIDAKLSGIIAMADTLKPNAVEAIAALKKMGKEIIMITGDNPKTAEAIGKQVGIDRVMAQVLPQDKEKVIAALQAEGKVVAMVGDGINDSPALARADLGIAIGSGTDVAIAAGEVILVKDDLRDVVTAIQLSGKTIKKVWQNLFWAFIYNLVAIPIAGGVHLLFTQSSLGVAAPWVAKFADSASRAGRIFYNFSQATLRPEIAGFAMAFSSVSVVLNSLILKLYTPPIEKINPK
ncbi:MAG: heavy metal translocating P-type ATPase, partial [Patescibacteria group bacterium]